VASRSDLSGKHVLVVEDEWFIADEISDALRRCGAAVVGPAADVERGRALAAAGEIDVAVLDVNLHGETVFDLARELRARGVPLLFATGYSERFLPAEFAEAPHFEKPLQIEQFLGAVAAACAAR
jgi:DNA-binding response OmpR family regulator